MTAKDAIKTALTSTQQVLTWYLSDLSDADLLTRPVPAANHVAWQLGHLIAAERFLISQNVPGAAYPELPAGFEERHHKTKAANEPPQGFATKGEYVALFNKVREATLANLAKLSDADLDKPTKGDIAKFAPTLGALCVLVSNHTLMHGGQITVLRRKLGKPVLF
ncbi:MAG: DinB family protein [Gemmataceae bacterium]|nr:DinB family protein [Gemmataceae bacterium]